MSLGYTGANDERSGTKIFLRITDSFTALVLEIILIRYYSDITPIMKHFENKAKNLARTKESNSAATVLKL